MRRIRVALLGLTVAVPAAFALPGAIAVQAGATQCSGINLGSFSTSFVTTHGTGAVGSTPATQVTITGSNFSLSNFTSGGTVYFSDSGGNQTVGEQFSSSNGSQFTVPAPNAGYTGPAEVCLNGVGGSYVATTSNNFSYVPLVTSVPTSATEGSTINLGGKFVSGRGATVHFSCGDTGSAQNASLTQLRVTIPGYCPGQISVTQIALDGTPMNGFTSAQLLAIQPTIGNPSPASTYPGQTVTVSGSGFGPSGTVSVGGTSAQVTGWSDGQVSFQAPDGTEGGIVQVNAPGGPASSGQALDIQPHITAVKPANATEGSNVEVDGQDFGSNPGTITVGGQQASLTGWGMDEATFTMPGAAGAVTLSTSDNRQAVNTGSVNLVPVVSGVSPSSAKAGDLVTISGSGFGQSATVTIGGKSAQVALPGDNDMAVVVPTGASTGKVVVTNAYGQSGTWSGTFTILSAAAPGSGGSTSSGGFTSTGPGGQIIIKPNYGFLPLPKAPTPIGFHITAPTDTAKPGATIPLTIVLQLNGKPVAGSPITLSIFKSPGTDTSLSALSGVTDANGTLVVRLKTSKKAGQTIVIARSGAFGDEVTINTISPTAATSGLPRTLITNTTLDPHVLIPFVGALILAVLLLLGAVVLQWRLHRRALLPAPAASTEAVAAPVEPAPKRSRRPRTPRVVPAEPVAEAAAEGPVIEPAVAESPAAEEPAELAQAVGAEDMVAAELPHEGIAPVIPLRKPRVARAVQSAQARRRTRDDGGTISRTRGRTKADP